MQATKILLVITIALGGSSSLFRAQGQQFGFREPEIVLIAPRSLQRFLREGQTALEQERYAEGIDSLGVLFDPNSERVPEDIRAQDFFLEREETQPAQAKFYAKTIKQEAAGLLGNLPPKGREILEIQFGVAARQRLDEALEKQDASGIEAVAREYPFTDAGFDAQVWIAQQRLHAGSPLAAAHIYRTLLSYSAARDRLGSELVRAASICWVLAGRAPKAVETLIAGTQYFPGATLRLAGKSIDLTDGEDWPKLAESMASFDYSQEVSANPDDWFISGGVPARNAVSKISMPLNSPRWIARTHGSLPERDALIALAATEREQRHVILPKGEVRMVGDLVLAKTNSAEVLAIDLKTGLTKWPYYLNSAPVDLMAKQISRTGMRSSSNVSEELKTRVWGSDAFGRFSCDASRLYYITEAKLQARSQRFQSYGMMVPSNQLRAISIEREGAIEWFVGTPSEGESERLAHEDLRDAFFLGPPLSFQGQLFCIVEMRGETRLVVLDPSTGALLWWQQLCNPSSMDSGSLRRSLALSPTIADGVILCPTGARALVAVDLVTHNLRWLVNYSASEAVSGGRNGLLSMSVFDPLAERWHENAVLAEDGLVATTVVDGDALYVRDLMSGHPVYRRSRQKGRYLAGMDDGKVYVVTDQSVVGLDMREERVLWSTTFPDGGMLAGKGIWQGDSMLIPLTGNRLIRISLSGKILEEATVEEPLGNLFVHRGNLISVSATAVAAYHSVDELRRSVQQRLAADSDDLEAINQKAQLAYASGNLEEAFEILRDSYQKSPENAETRSYLIEIILAGLEEDFETYYGIAREFEEVFEDSPKRESFLKNLALGSLRNGEPKVAFQNLMAFLRSRLDRRSGVPSLRRSTLRLSETHRVDSDIWIATELSRSYEQASEAIRQDMDSQVEEVLAGSSSLVLSQKLLILNYFDWHPRGQRLLLDAAIELMNDASGNGPEQTSAEEILIGLARSPWEDISAVAQRLLARRTEEDINFFGPRGKILDSIYDSTGSLQSLDPDEGADPTDPVEWNQGVVLFDSLKESYFVPKGARVDLDTQRFGRPEIDIKLSGDEVVLSNMNGGRVESLLYRRASADNSSLFHRATLVGGLLLLETSSEIVGFDIYRGLKDPRNALLWRQSLLSTGEFNEKFAPAQTKLIDTPFGQPIVRRQMGRQAAMVGPLTPGGLILHRGSSVSCINPYSGREIWNRDGYVDPVQFAFRGYELAISNEGSNTVEFVDSRDGREDLARRMPMEKRWKSWFSSGEYMVDFQEKESEQLVNEASITTSEDYRPVFKIWSPWQAEPKLSLDSLRLNSRAASCEGRYLVIADQSYQLHFLDLQTGGYHKFQVEVDERLASIELERFGNHLVVMSRNKLSQDERTYLGKKNSDHPDLKLVNGSVYAIDLTTNKLLWEKPAKLYAMSFPRNQPRSTPFMLTYRFDAAVGGSGETAQIALLDLRDGKFAYANPAVVLENGELSDGHSFSMEYYPREQKALMLLRNQNFTFKCTNQTGPPQPVAHFGYLDILDDAALFPIGF